MPDVDYQGLFTPYLVATYPDASGEWRAWCPLCQGVPNRGPLVADADASFNFGKRLFNCFRGACGWGGTLAQLVRYLEEEELPIGQAANDNPIAEPDEMEPF
jgi:hypothetical protein